MNARPWRGGNPPGRILAVRIQALGDMIATFPYLRALRRSLPESRLDFVTRDDYAELARSVHLADDVLVVRGMSQRAQALSVLALMPKLVRRRYDVVLDLQHSRVSRIIRTLVRPAAWSEYDRFSPRLAGERYRATIEAIGLGQLDVTPDLILKDPSSGLRKLEAAGWMPDHELVILNPAGLVGDRHWPTDRYVSFARSFAESHPRPVTFAVLGVEKVRERARAMRAGLGDQLVDLVGQTSLTEAVAIVHQAVLVVSEDGGLMHMAWTLGVPTVGLFGASRPVWARPHGNYCRLVNACLESDGACLDGRCRRGPPSCLHALPVEPVLVAARAAVRLPVGGKIIARGGLPAMPVD